MTTERMLDSGNLIRVCGCRRILIWSPRDPRPACQCEPAPAVVSVGGRPLVDSKACTRCGETKTRADFLNKTGTLRQYCLPCNRIVAMEYYRRKHPAKPKKEPTPKPSAGPRVYPLLTSKACPRCKEVKPRAEFTFDSGRLGHFCMECRREDGRERWRAKHPPKPKPLTSDEGQAPGTSPRGHRGPKAGEVAELRPRATHREPLPPRPTPVQGRKPAHSPAGQASKKAQAGTRAARLPAPAAAAEHKHPFVHVAPRPPEPSRLPRREPPAGSGLGMSWPCSHTMDMANSRCVRCCLLKPKHYVLRKAAGGSPAAWRWLCDGCLAVYVGLGLVDPPRAQPVNPIPVSWSEWEIKRQAGVPPGQIRNGFGQLVGVGSA